jgi:hypothetical protein
MGQIQETVRAMLNHRGTENYTRDKVRDICRREMPQLSEAECDLATDFSIAAAREVASVSQYAAAYRNLNPGPEYRDALEQIVTLSRGPKVDAGYPVFPLAVPSPQYMYPVKSHKAGSVFKPLYRRDEMMQSEEFQGGSHAPPPANTRRDIDSRDLEFEAENFDAYLDTTRSYQSSKESDSGSGTPLAQFIRSLRTASEMGDPSNEIDTGMGVSSPSPASTDSSTLPSAQPRRKAEINEQSNQYNLESTNEDEEIEELLRQRSGIEKELERDPLSDLEEFENDGHEFSQTF